MMPIADSVVCIQGSHLGAIEGLLARLGYEPLGAPQSCSTAREAAAALRKPTEEGVLKMAVYEAGGWTYLVDSSFGVMSEGARLSEIARERSMRIFAWSFQELSRSRGFYLLDPDMKREIAVFGSNVVVETGDRLPEEGDIDWPASKDADVLALAQRIGAPYDRMSVDRPYLVLTHRESAANREAYEKIMNMEPEEPIKPWWKFW